MKDRANEIARNAKYESKCTKLGSGVNEDLAEELHRSVIKKFNLKKSLCEI